MNLESIYTLLVTTAIPTVLSTGFLSVFLNWKISSFQKREDKSIEISIKLLENVFNKYDFNYYNEVYGKINKSTTKKNLETSFSDIRNSLDNFKKTAVKAQLSAYIYELKVDSIRINRNIKNLEKQLINLKDDEKVYLNFYPESNKIVYEYDYFVSRYNSAISRYRKTIGSKITPEQNRAAQSNRVFTISIISFLFLIFFIILALLAKRYSNSITLENFLVGCAMTFLFLCITLLIGNIYDGIRYRIRTSTAIKRGMDYVKIKFMNKLTSNKNNH